MKLTEKQARALTEKQLSKIIGRPVEVIRTFVREGMTPNPDGTFCLFTCIAWKLQQDPPEPVRMQPIARAKEWLQDILDDGAVPVKEIYQEGAKAYVGLSERTIDRAKAALGIVAKKQGKVWFWELPTDK